MVRKNSLLIVEDDRAIQEFLGDLLGLQGEGYNIVKAASVDEAVEALAKEDFEVVTLDGEFPGGGGSCLVKILRMQYPAIKILSIAGEMKTYGDRNFQKPIDVDEITKAVGSLIS